VGGAPLVVDLRVRGGDDGQVVAAGVREWHAGSAPASTGLLRSVTPTGECNFLTSFKREISV